VVKVKVEVVDYTGTLHLWLRSYPPTLKLRWARAEIN